MANIEGVESDRVAAPLEEAMEVDGRDDVRVGIAVGKTGEERANDAFRISNHAKH